MLGCRRRHQQHHCFLCPPATAVAIFDEVNSLPSSHESAGPHWCVIDLAVMATLEHFDLAVIGNTRTLDDQYPAAISSDDDTSITFSPRDDLVMPSWAPVEYPLNTNKLLLLHAGLPAVRPRSEHRGGAGCKMRSRPSRNTSDPNDSTHKEASSSSHTHTEIARSVA